MKAIPGYVKTVTKGNFVGVVAESEWAAVRAAKELEGEMERSPAASFPDDVYRHMRVGDNPRRRGNCRARETPPRLWRAPRKKWKPATSGLSRRTPPWGRGAPWRIFAPEA